MEPVLGMSLGTSDWLTITQERIDMFATATGDHNWIHVDRDRAARESPFGATIAHGFLSLSLIPALKSEIFQYSNVKMLLNYGTDKVRFTAPVRVDSRVRLESTLVSAVDAPDGAVRVVARHTLHVEGQPKPALVADAISRILFRHNPDNEKV